MAMRPAQYLLRFDDLCPTMSRSGWQRFEALIDEFGVRPMLAVVPDNGDPELEVEDADAEFWAKMRAREAEGAAIALHGYRHVCASRSGGMLALHEDTEFAGVAEDTQRRWIGAGLEILREHGLSPRLWVAPRHGFDRSTLRALRREGIEYLSDGFARVAQVRGGVTWIPQQLWGPVEKRAGLWTICVHANRASDDEVKELRRFVAGHAERFTSFDRVVEEYRGTPLGLVERGYEELAVWRMRVRRMKRGARGARVQA